LRSRRLTFALAALAAAGAICAAYSNHFDNDFHFDDSHVIQNNLAIRSLHDVGRFFTDTGTFTARPENASYRPLLTLSYAVDYRLGGGLVPRQFHRTQFALHLLLWAALVALFWRLGELAAPGRANPWVGLVAATLFAIHTANTETVNYLSSRSDLVATLGVTLALVTYLELPRARRLQLHLLPMVVAGLAKPLTVMLAPLLVLFSLLFEERLALDAALDRRGRQGLLCAVRRHAVGLAVAGALFWLLGRMEGAALQYSDVDRWTYARIQPFVWLHYLRLFVLPVGLTADTDWTFATSWSDPRVALGLLGVAALAWATVRLSREPRLRPAAFGLGWFALALLPSSSLFPLAEVYNEHRLFFPFVGTSLAAVWLVWRLLDRLGGATRTWLGAGLALALLAAHGVGTYARNMVWRTEESLWRDVTRKSPRNGRGLMNYGLTLMAGGDLRGALEQFERAHVHSPNYPVLEVNLGIVKAALGDDAAAERHFTRALDLAPAYAQGRYYYARWLCERRRGPEAVAELERALAASATDLEAHLLLLRLRAAAGDAAGLAAQLRRTLELSPGEPTAVALARGGLPFDVPPAAEALDARGQEYDDRGNWIDAALVYGELVELDPTSAAAWSKLGRARAQLGFDAAARACFVRAAELGAAD